MPIVGQPITKSVRSAATTAATTPAARKPVKSNVGSVATRSTSVAVTKTIKAPAVPDAQLTRPAPAKRVVKNPCKACEGYGRSSKGQPCVPCRGTGSDLSKKVWTCPLCNIEHVGFVENKCRNKACYGSKGGR